MAKNIICFDLEGPLSPQDNAYEVMGSIENGYKIFEIISRYDDILTLEGKPGYEPGDTLSLILPFLLYHDISGKDISRISDTAKIVDGVKYMISELESLGWDSYIISTSYQQHALNIAKKIGLPKEKVHCTSLELDKYRDGLNDSDMSLIKNLEYDILNTLHPAPDDESIKKILDGFYYRDAKKTTIGNFIDQVSVVGGKRKVAAAKKIAESRGKTLKDIVVVGDSITDYKMLAETKGMGGISVVFNGNSFAIPYAGFGLASPDMRFLLVIIDAYMRNGKEGATNTVIEWEKRHDEFMRHPGKIPDDLIPGDVRDFLKDILSNEDSIPPYFHYLEGANKEKQEEVVMIHKRAREFVRGSAAKLG